MWCQLNREWNIHIVLMCVSKWTCVTELRVGCCSILVHGFFFVECYLLIFFRRRAFVRIRTSSPMMLFQSHIISTTLQCGTTSDSFSALDRDRYHWKTYAYAYLKEVRICILGTFIPETVFHRLSSLRSLVVNRSYFASSALTLHLEFELQSSSLR